MRQKESTHESVHKRTSIGRGKQYIGQGKRG